MRDIQINYKFKTNSKCLQLSLNATRIGETLKTPFDPIALMIPYQSTRTSAL